MSLEKTTYVERVLIVLNSDGTLKGAAQYSLSTITDDGEVISTQDGAAEVVNEATLASLLPDTATLTAQVSQLQAELTTSTEQISTLEAQIATLQAQLSGSQT